MKDIYLGLGSNMGDRTNNIEKTYEIMEQEGIQVIQKSQIYETEPYGVKDQEWFYNVVVQVETELSPEKLLKKIKEIEVKVGRKKTYKWGPRVIDIDILMYEDQVIESEALTIPHKFLRARKFVLKPFAEVALNRQHPIFKKSIQELLNECEDDSIVSPL